MRGRDGETDQENSGEPAGCGPKGCSGLQKLKSSKHNQKQPKSIHIETQSISLNKYDIRGVTNDETNEYEPEEIKPVKSKTKQPISHNNNNRNNHNRNNNYSDEIEDEKEGDKFIDKNKTFTKSSHSNHRTNNNQLHHGFVKNNMTS